MFQSHTIKATTYIKQLERFFHKIYQKKYCFQALQDMTSV